MQPILAAPLLFFLAGVHWVKTSLADDPSHVLGTTKQLCPCAHHLLPIMHTYCIPCCPPTWARVKTACRCKPSACSTCQVAFWKQAALLCSIHQRCCENCTHIHGQVPELCVCATHSLRSGPGTKVPHLLLVAGLKRLHWSELHSTNAIHKCKNTCVWLCRCPSRVCLPSIPCVPCRQVQF
jgi:hypothetical protein